MPALSIVLEEPAWPDLADKQDQLIHVTEPFAVTRLAGGMESGLPSVAIRIDLPDGRIVIAETSQALWVAAARAFEARTEFEEEQYRAARQ